MEKSRTPSIHKIPERVIVGIWDRVDVRDWLECWPWKLSIGSHGYGQVGWGLEDGRATMTTAHRVAWIAVNGPIPEGMTVDHVWCRNRSCCNPLHLRLLENVENARDNGQQGKSHCPRGHPYSGENLMLRPNGHRLCRRCANERRRLPRAENRG